MWIVPTRVSAAPSMCGFAPFNGLRDVELERQMPCAMGRTCLKTMARLLAHFMTSGLNGMYRCGPSRAEYACRYDQLFSR